MPNPQFRPPAEQVKLQDAALIVDGYRKEADLYAIYQPQTRSRLPVHVRYELTEQEVKSKSPYSKMRVFSIFFKNKEFWGTPELRRLVRRIEQLGWTDQPWTKETIGNLPALSWSPYLGNDEDDNEDKRENQEAPMLGARQYAEPESVEMARRAIADMGEDELIDFRLWIVGLAAADAPRFKEILSGLEEYLEHTDEFQDGFDAAMMMMTGWTLPSLVQRYMGIE